MDVKIIDWLLNQKANFYTLFKEFEMDKDFLEEVVKRDKDSKSFWNALSAHGRNIEGLPEFVNKNIFRTNVGISNIENFLRSDETFKLLLNNEEFIKNENVKNLISKGSRYNIEFIIRSGVSLELFLELISKNPKIIENTLELYNQLRRLREVVNLNKLDFDVESEIAVIVSHEYTLEFFEKYVNNQDDQTKERFIEIMLRNLHRFDMDLTIMFRERIVKIIEGSREYLKILKPIHLLILELEEYLEALERGEILSFSIDLKLRNKTRFRRNERLREALFKLFELSKSEETRVLISSVIPIEFSNNIEDVEEVFNRFKNLMSESEIENFLEHLITQNNADVSFLFKEDKKWTKYTELLKRHIIRGLTWYTKGLSIDFIEYLINEDIPGRSLITIVENCTITEELFIKYSDKLNFKYVNKKLNPWAYAKNMSPSLKLLLSTK